MIIRLLIVISFMLICTSVNGLCEIYKWKNDDGSIGFTDTYGNVPEQYRDQVEIKKYRSNEYKGSSNRDVPHIYNKKTVYREPDTRYSEDKKQELSEEEKQEIDREIRDVWNGMKESLKRGKIK